MYGGPRRKPSSDMMNAPQVSIPATRMTFQGTPLMGMMWTPIDTLWDPTEILEYLPKKAKIQILIENFDPTFTSETQTKGISNRLWSNDYNGTMNQRYKVWTPQGKIPDKFIVLEEPKEEQILTFSYFYSIAVPITMSACYL